MHEQQPETQTHTHTDIDLSSVWLHLCQLPKEKKAGLNGADLSV